RCECGQVEQATGGQSLGSISYAPHRMRSVLMSAKENRVVAGPEAPTRAFLLPGIAASIGPVPPPSSFASATRACRTHARPVGALLLWSVLLALLAPAPASSQSAIPASRAGGVTVGAGAEQATVVADQIIDVGGAT